MTKLFIGLGVSLLVWAWAPIASADWAVIKDSTGKCAVRSVKAATPKTIAGPFKTKEEALQAKKEKCGKTDAKKADKKKPK